MLRRQIQGTWHPGGIKPGVNHYFTGVASFSSRLYLRCFLFGLLLWPWFGLPDAISAGAAQASEPEPSLQSDEEEGANSASDESKPDEGEGGAPSYPGGLPFPLATPSAQESRAGRRQFIGAITFLSQYRPEKAIKVLEPFQPSERLAQVYRTFLLAKAYTQVGRYHAADSVLELALTWVGSLSWRNELVRHRLLGFARFESPDSVKREFYSQVIASDASRKVKAEVLYAWLKLEGYRGDVRKHRERLQSLLNYASGDKAFDSVYRQAYALTPPGEREWDDEWLMLGMESVLGAYNQALARCETLLGKVPGPAEKKKLHWKYASLQYAKRDWAKALEMYQKYLERYGDNPDAYLQVARCQDKLGLQQKSQLTYDRFLELYPKHSKTSEIHWLRAWEKEADGNYAEAIELYYLQLSRFSRTRRADWANFRIGLCLFKDSNFAAAADAFATYRRETSYAIKPGGMLWEAKMQARLGRKELADSLRKAIARDYPFGFYGHLARQALEAEAPLPDSLQPWSRFTSSRPERIQAWLKEKVPGYKPVLDKSYESAYLDLSQLLEFRLDTLAILTMRSTPAHVKRNPWYLFVHARRFQNYDMHPEAYKLARALAQLIPAIDLATAPREVLRLIWPRPYEGEVLHYALERNLDPAYLYALMRQESGFDREIKSRAGAVGLMQLMPATARDQAVKDSLKDFHPEDLASAEINVRLGTFYIRKLLDDFDGNPYFTLANYNAGPGPARRWFKTLGWKPVDEMVEDISYWETRDYVKKVMGNYWTYKMLYNNRIGPNQRLLPGP